MSYAAQNPLACPSCGATWPYAAMDLATLQNCPRCSKETRLVLFPAFDRPVAVGATAQAVVMEGEATCFFHPQKRAHVPCDGCGRFLCALCELDLGGKHLCAQCLEAGTKKGSLDTLERSRTRWDQIIAGLLVLPLVFCYFLVPFTSLAALGLVIWKWKAPRSRVGNTRLTLIICAVLASVELIGSVAAWLMLFGGFRAN